MISLCGESNSSVYREANKCALLMFICRQPQDGQKFQEEEEQQVALLLLIRQIADSEEPL